MTTNIPQPELGHPQPGVTDEQSNLELREVVGLSQSQIVRRRFFRHKGAVISMIVLALVVLLATTSVGITIGPIRTPGWWPFNWSGSNSIVNGTRPSLEHPFGQDEIGRDIFAVVMRGAQQSLLVMVVAGLIATIIGTVLGSVAGFYRRAVDSVIMRFTDVILTIPLIVIGAVLGRTLGNLGSVMLGVVIGIFSWTSLARLVRAEFLSLREREFVDAARVAGASDGRIIFRHILPNAVGVIIVNATLLMATAILLETALSFLGFGVQSPDTSLGKIISDNQAAFATRPWLFWWPGLFIVVIALCINFIGDGLRDAFDPRQKRMPSARVLARGGRGPRTPKADDAVRVDATPPTREGIGGRGLASDEPEMRDKP